MTVRVLVADDQSVVRTGLRMIVDREPDLEVVGEAADGHAAVDLAGRVRPDVVLMDVRMPRLDGIQAAARLAATAPDAQVIVLTTFDLDEYVFGALRAGVAGFLLKTAGPADLLRAIRLVAAGQGLFDPGVVRRLVEAFAQPPPVAPALRTLPDTLTGREREVLVLVARGLPNGEIARTLAVGESTVRTHVKHLMAKLGLRSRAQAVVLAYETGLVRPGTPG